MEILHRLQQIRIIPVVSVPSVDKAVPLAEALVNGGLPCAEITFRTAAAAGSIAAIRTRFPELLLGAGTVLTTQQAQTAIDAGAEFIVSPGSNPTTIRFCQERNVAIFPGVCTPTEIEINLSLGINVMKFFPAEAAGGLKLLKAVCAPFKDVCFIPTGGIDQNNIRDYLANKQVIACGGSWMVKTELVEAGDFTEIRRLSIEARALVKD